LLLAASFGYLLGSNLALHSLHESNPISLKIEERELIPTVQLFGVENGQLLGIGQGDIRFFIRGEQVSFHSDGSFQVPAGPLLINEVRIHIPLGSRFVASRRGEKYYPVFTSSAERISPKNRIYFQNRANAEAAGYRS